MKYITRSRIRQIRENINKNAKILESKGIKVSELLAREQFYRRTGLLVELRDMIERKIRDQRMEENSEKFWNPSLLASLRHSGGRGVSKDLFKKTYGTFLAKQWENSDIIEEAEKNIKQNLNKLNDEFYCYIEISKIKK